MCSRSRRSRRSNLRSPWSRSRLRVRDRGDRSCAIDATGSPQWSRWALRSPAAGEPGASATGVLSELRSLTLPARQDPTITSGIAYLVKHQSPDGSWRSDRYATFKDGTALTPLVVCALQKAGGSPEAVRQGCQFLAKSIPIGDEGTLDYPAYTAALSVTALSREVRRVPELRKAPTPGSNTCSNGNSQRDSAGSPKIASSAVGAIAGSFPKSPKPARSPRRSSNPISQRLSSPSKHCRKPA